jgi:Neuraminidase (sialidase)
VYTMLGAAWAGETEVSEISVSTDGGQTWPEAEFISGEAETEDSQPRLSLRGLG